MLDLIIKLLACFLVIIVPLVVLFRMNHVTVNSIKKRIIINARNVQRKYYREKGNSYIEHTSQFLDTELTEEDGRRILRVTRPGRNI